MASAPTFPKNGATPYHFTPWLPLMIPLCSRLIELFVTGHGLDPSIPIHVAHHSFVFLTSLVAQGLLRAYTHHKQRTVSTIHFFLDMVVLLLLALAWVEKQSSDTARNGYMLCQATLALLGVGIVLSMLDVASSNKGGSTPNSVWTEFLYYSFERSGPLVVRP